MNSVGGKINGEGTLAQSGGGGGSAVLCEKTHRTWHLHLGLKTLLPMAACKANISEAIYVVRDP